MSVNYRKLWIREKGPIPVDKQGRSFEIHHIDGNRNNNSIENLQCLSAEDHFKLHYDKQEFFAANLIAKRLGRSLKSVITWSMTEETKEKLRESKLGDKNPMKNPETAKKVADALRGRKKSEEAERKRLETARKNGTLQRTSETREKMRKPKQKLTCPFCEKEGGLPQMIRWHFDNCKKK